jgi:hypothetical protein
VQGCTNPTTTATLYSQKKGGTDFNAVGVNNLLPPYGRIIWLRMSDNGTNVTYEYSWDKINLKLSVTQGRTVGFTTAPDKVAFAAQVQSASISTPIVGWIVSWEVG